MHVEYKLSDDIGMLMQDKGAWMRSAKEKLAQSLRLNGEASTRGYRVQFYAQQLAIARQDVEYYEELLCEEEQGCYVRQ